MVLDQQRSQRKETGARYKRQHAKKKHVMGRDPSMTKIDEKPALRKIRVRGGQEKNRLLRTNVANVFDPKTKKYVKAKIEAVVENPANRHYVRRNVMTKGTVVKTNKGNAKITSRPGQDGVINAILV
ncbi:30S ribosomal protein S8e [archaeon]|jgi:small subunit ribosomal protein S8e|nr:30S ribosomal protein S8e [archaeon]MBT4023204.1 30S ribosomal protein S8e [archaeon]MBT4272410.1 30S ribosomal protein S8e [archaeon]MBT4460973.1 30S ribosomal protein S8e [archaeon]MBT4859113.1 30S ribosomal protein S8e [archaeon]